MAKEFFVFLGKRNTDSRAAILLVVIFCSVAIAVQGQSTEFVYQGQLQNSSVPANGNFDFEFLLYDALTGGTQLGPTVSQNNVVVVNGLFSVKLSFGTNFPGANRFLEIRVRQAGIGSFTTLAPRQAITSSPYSVRSLSAVNADTAVTATTAISATNADNATNATTAMNFSGALSGDVSGTQGNTTVAKLRGVALDSTLPTNGQVLTYNGPTNKWTPAPPATGSSTPANYVFAYAQGGQVGLINFQSIPLINGWTNLGGTFTCPQSGLYLIQYTGVTRTDFGIVSVMSVYINGQEVAGSRTGAWGLDSNASNRTPLLIPISKSILSNMSTGDTLYVSSNVGVIDTLLNGSWSSATLTITQIK